MPQCNARNMVAVVWQELISRVVVVESSILSRVLLRAYRRLLETAWMISVQKAQTVWMDELGVGSCTLSLADPNRERRGQTARKRC